MPTREVYHAENAHDHFKQIYFKALDAIINAIKDRYDQSELFLRVEQLFLKSAEWKDITDELKWHETHFKDDYDNESLIGKLKLLPAIFKECNSANFEEIVNVPSSLSLEKCTLIFLSLL